MTEEKNAYLFQGKGIQIRFDKNTGALNSYILHGKEQIKQPLMPHFTRPLTDNDRRGWKPNKKLQQWYDAKPKLVELTAEKKNERATVVAKYSVIPDNALVILRYYISSIGVVEVDYTLQANPALPNIPKIGMQCGINREYANISWYGKGPLENYIDRNTGFDAAIYEENIKDFMEHMWFRRKMGIAQMLDGCFLQTRVTKA
jgi:beta-galactosidase